VLKLKKVKTIILKSSIVIITVFGVIYFMNPFTKDSDMANYYGSNNYYSISLTRFLDYESFLKEKADSIWVYNTKEDFSDNKGYIAGEIQIKDAEENKNIRLEQFQNLKIKLIRKSGWNTSSTTMNFEEPKEGVSTVPFIAYDFNDTENNIYKEAILRIGDSEITIELKRND
jgi:hypothetical protein